MRRERNKRNKIIIALVAALFLMATGYAAFQTQLKINGTSNIASTWDIRITNVSSGTKTGNGENAKTPTWNNLTASMEANLYAKGDAVEYEVTVENKGTFDAKLEDISFGGGSNDAIKITSSGYTKGEKLFKNSSQKIKVKVQYNPAFVGTPTNNTNEVTIGLNYGQASGSNVPSTNDYLLTYDCTTNGGDACTDNNEYVTEGKGVDLTKTGTKTGWAFVGWNTNKVATTGLVTLNMLNKETTVYAIFRKEAITYTANFNANGNTVVATSKTCTIAAVYNTATQATSCTLTTPVITAPSNTLTIVGYGTSASSTTSTVGSNATLTMTSSNNKSTYYAITRKNQVSYVATYTKGTGVSAIGSASGSCTIPATYNGTAQASTCSLTLPSITALAGYITDGWYNSSNAKVGNASGVINIKASATYTAKANDVTVPTVSLSPSSNGTWTTGGTAVTATLSDAGSGLLASQAINYAWSTSNTSAPTTWSSVTTTNTAGATSTTVSIPATSNSSLSGTYYLWIKASTLSDVSGNKSNQVISGAFKFDNGVPTLSVSTSKTTNSITVTSNASATSGISKYEYSKDNGATWVTGTNNVYTFTGLTKNTSYNIKSRVTSGCGKQSISTNIVTVTNDIVLPTFTQRYEYPDASNLNVIVTITYPSGCGSLYTCSYTKNDGKVVTVTTTSVQEYFFSTTGNDNIVAKITDGANTVASSYAVITKPQYNYTGSPQIFTATSDGYYKIRLYGAQGGAQYGFGGKGAYTSGEIYLTKGTNLYVYIGNYPTNAFYECYESNANDSFNGSTVGSCVGGGGATDVRLVSGAWNDATSLRSRIMVAAGGGGAYYTGSGGSGGDLFGQNGNGNASSSTTTSGIGGTPTSGNAFGIAGRETSVAGGGYYGGRAIRAGNAGGGSSYISGYAGVNSVASVSSGAHTDQTNHYSGKYFINTSMTPGNNSGNGKAVINYIGRTPSSADSSKIKEIRYIKDCTNGSTIDSLNKWTEIQAISNGNNVAKEKKVIATASTATVVESTISLESIVDGRISNEDRNYFQTKDNGPQCVTIDLGQEYNLEEIALWHYPWDRSPKGNITYVAGTDNQYRALTDGTNNNETHNGYRIKKDIAKVSGKVNIISPYVKGGTLLLSKTSGAPGDTVIITATPTANGDFTYQGATLVCPDKETTEISGTSFTIPNCNGDVMVYPKWKKNALVWSLPAGPNNTISQWDNYGYDVYKAPLWVPDGYPYQTRFESPESTNSRNYYDTKIKYDLTDYKTWITTLHCYSGSTPLSGLNQWKNIISSHTMGGTDNYSTTVFNGNSTDISNYNGSYYLQLHVLVNGTTFWCAIMENLLEGGTYSYTNPS